MVIKSTFNKKITQQTHNMKTVNFVLAFILVLFISKNTMGTEDPSGQPPSAYIMPYEPRTPSTQGLLNYIDFANTGNNGAPDITIPLYEIKSRELNLPLSLSYNATGIKVADEAGNVGLNWNLIAGGMISRTIRDKADDGSYWNSVYNNVISGFDPHTDFADFQLAQGLLSPSVDGSPDLYSYNLPGGGSGKFLDIIGSGIKMMPQRDVRIERTTMNSQYPQLWNYKITAEDGTQYYFEDIERSRSRSENSTDLTGITWYLTKIVSANVTDEINFHYADIETQSFPSFGETHTYSYPLCNQTGGGTSTSNAYTSFSSLYFIHGKQLDRIEYPGGSVVFELGTTREDAFMDGSTSVSVPKVDKIFIKNTQGTTTQTIVFNYEYYNPGSTVPFSKRLKLNSVDFEGASSSAFQNPAYSYQFEYDNTTLPPLNSKNVDHWGYFNGKNNSTVIPSYPFETFHECHTSNPYCPCQPTTTGLVFSGGDRSVDPSKSKAGILTKIIYPTGGFTEFEYESNELDPTQEVKNISYTVDAYGQSAATTGTDVIVKTPATISLANNPLANQGVCAKISIDYVHNLSNTELHVLTHNQPYVELYDSIGDVVLETFDLNINIDHNSTHIEFDITLDPNIRYALVAHTKINGSTFNISIRYNAPFYFQKRHFAGGLRLKKKIVNESITSNPIVTKYEYSGANVINPNYESYSSTYTLRSTENGATTCQLTYCGGTSSTNTSGYSKDNFRHLTGYLKGVDPRTNYSEIKTINGETGENGTIVRHYESTNEQNSEDWEFWRVGNVIDENYYNSNNVLIKEIHNTYTYNTSQEAYFPGTSVRYLDYLHCYDPSTSNFANLEVLCALNPSSTNLSTWYYQNSTEETTYDLNGQNGVTVRKDFYYDNSLHKQLTRIKTTSSNGNEYWTYNKFPKDYNTVYPTLDAQSTAIKSLQDKHIDNTPIQTATAYVDQFENQYLLNASFTEYANFNGKVLPSKIYQSELTSPLATNTSFSISDLTKINAYGNCEKITFLKLKSELINYSDNGRILNYRNNGGAINSVQWDQSEINPVALFNNATYDQGAIGNECEFIGFEGQTVSYSPASTTSTIDAHTGLMCNAIVPDGNVDPPYKSIVKTFNPSRQDLKYKVSAWVKTGSGFSQGELVIKALNSNGSEIDYTTYPSAYKSIPIDYSQDWTYYETVLDLEEVKTDLGISGTLQFACYVVNNETLSGRWLRVDDIRIHPVDAAAKTYTYEPLFDEVSSISDSRSLPVYYYYDNFSRLQYAADQSHNILEAYEYHYANTADPKNWTKKSNPRIAHNNISTIDNLLTYQGQINRAISYLDGLGRPIQSVSVHASPDKFDVVQPFAYDNFGREKIKYLQYELGSGGAYHPNAFTEQVAFYTSTQNPSRGIASSTKPWAETVFESSPLNRVKEQGALGEDWQPGNHTVKSEYGTNGENEVLLWQVNLDGNGYPTGATFDPAQTHFAVNQLYKTTTTDENGNHSFEYKDKLGRTILKRNEVFTVAGAGSIRETKDYTNGGSTMTGTISTSFFDTYYVYDDMGRLTYVIPPQAVVLFGGAGFDHTSTTFNELVYAYKYDERGRMVEKKIPGQNGWHWMVYNKLDQVVMASDPKQHSSSGTSFDWIFTKYDVLGREVMTGLFTATGDRSTWQTQINNQTVTLWEERIVNTDFRYSNNTLTNGTLTVYTVNYYDNYDWDAQGKVFEPWNSNSQSKFTMGLLTGTKVNILGTSNYLTTVNYYDDKARLIQEHKQHQLFGWDKINNEYDFINQLVNSTRYHSTSFSATTFGTSNAYNNNGLLLSISKSVNGIPKLLATYDYNKLGQLKSKTFPIQNWYQGLAQYQRVDYRYNIRGWLASINNAELLPDPGTSNDYNDVFGEEIYYNDPPAGSNTFTFLPQYNGNIAEIRFASKAPEVGVYYMPIHAYTYRYDNLNRLTGGYYAGSTPQNPGSHFTNTDMFTEKQSFDMMGNITSLLRYGDIGGTKEIIDELSLSYGDNGNKLSIVDDAASDHLQHDFNDAVNNAFEYFYDENGNTTTDQNKDIITEYNYLNLPVTATKQSGGQVIYTYDATGRKLSKKLGNNTRHYIDGIEYDNNSMQLLMTEEGRINFASGSSGFYEYFIKDHLGSIRAVVTDRIDFSSEYVATMEYEYAGVEEEVFLNIPLTREYIPLDMPEDSTYVDPNRQVCMLEGDSRPIGHAKVLRVRAGDILNFRTSYFYEADTIPYSRHPVYDILTHLAYIFVINNPIYQGYSPQELSHLSQQYFTENQSMNEWMVTNMLNGNGVDTAAPYSFLTYMFLDDNFQVVPGVSGALQADNPESLGQLAVTNLSMPMDGYLYIYVNNTSNSWVYFDDLYISHAYSSLASGELNNYYPFGMQWKVPENTGNKYKYNGKELQTELDLFTEDYGARYYDPAVPHWTTVDPLAEKYLAWSPNTYCMSNPIKFVDPDGMQVFFGIGNYTITNATQYNIPKPLIRTVTKVGEVATKTAEGVTKVTEATKPTEVLPKPTQLAPNTTKPKSNSGDIIRGLTKEETSKMKPEYKASTEVAKDIPQIAKPVSPGSLPLDNLGKVAAAGTAGYLAYDFYQKTKAVVNIPLAIPKEEKKKPVEVKSSSNR